MHDDVWSGRIRYINRIVKADPKYVGAFYVRNTGFGERTFDSGEYKHSESDWHNYAYQVAIAQMQVRTRDYRQQDLTALIQLHKLGRTMNSPGDTRFRRPHRSIDWARAVRWDPCHRRCPL